MEIESLFSNSLISYVSSDRILYTSSSFSRSSLLHLQEIGTLKALKVHTSSRSNLRSYLFFTVTKGSGSLFYDDKEYKLTEGSCVFIDCQKMYSHTTDPDDLWSLRWCHFYGPNLSMIYEKYMQRGGKPAFKSDAIERFLQVLDVLYSLASGDDYIRDMRINEQLNGLCTLLMAESWHPENAAELLNKKASVIPVKEFLDKHYNEKITLDDLSRAFFINKYYLTKVFKDQFGMSITSYLQNVRITHAKQMLRFTEKSIEEIGMECGMGALHYFSRVFKDIEGVAPTVYRNQW